MRKLLLAGMILAGLPPGLAPAQDPSASTLVAHEWGTFTALQDDDGTALGAINADDEPVPDFVCRAGFVRIAKSGSELTPLLLGGKGIIPSHPGVTMRLETPVIYFYPPRDRPAAPVSVHVTFNGGWLTEFYPRAVVEAPDLMNARVSYPPLSAATHGSLSWNGARLGGPAGALTPTTDPVWTTPREVPRAAIVTMPSSTPADGSGEQAEKFLFYRGVGHLDAPVRVVRDRNSDGLRLLVDTQAMRPPPGAEAAATVAGPHVRAAWLVEIRPEDGFCAYSPVEAMMEASAPGGARGLPGEQARFGQDFAPGNLQKLRDAMSNALEEEGLFPDEAAAMLKTWDLSYFKTPGRRLFYIVPRAWTDRVLPLSIEGAEVTRVMMGRIELVTPAQRALLSRISAGPCPDMEVFSRRCWEAINAKAALYNEARSKNPAAVAPYWAPPTLAEMNVTVPAIYQDYLDLGRFHDALVLHEQAVRPTPALRAFLVGNGLQVGGTDQLTLEHFQESRGRLRL